MYLKLDTRESDNAGKTLNKHQSFIAYNFLHVNYDLILNYNRIYQLINNKLENNGGFEQSQ